MATLRYVNNPPGCEVRLMVDEKSFTIYVDNNVKEAKLNKVLTEVGLNEGIRSHLSRGCTNTFNFDPEYINKSDLEVYLNELFQENGFKVN
jgi:hypothetical protein